MVYGRRFDPVEYVSTATSTDQRPGLATEIDAQQGNNANETDHEPDAYRRSHA
jgi:hypothetical protein